MSMILDTEISEAKNFFKVFFKFQIIEVILQFKKEVNGKIQSSFLEWSVLGWGVFIRCCKQNKQKSPAKVNLYVTPPFAIYFTDFQTDFIQSGSLQESPKPCRAQTKHIHKQF